MGGAILGFGAYIPRLRLQRRAIAEANGWFNAALKAQGKGERAICNWDEDTITMAVEAARDCLHTHDRDAIKSVAFASTTFPFLDRLNAGIVSEALALSDQVAAMDIAATQRAGTTALLNALRQNAPALVVASEQRQARAASPIEMTAGDAAAALLVGPGEGAAQLIGSATATADFVDHFRTIASTYDYGWEERWIRDAGYLELVPPVVRRALSEAGVSAADVNHFCMPGTLPKLANAVAKACGLNDGAVRDALHAQCGEAGAAHALIMLVATLEAAAPGDLVLVVGFGQGVDALLFRVGTIARQSRPRLGVKGHLARRKEEGNYAKFLAVNENIDLERGMRAETDKLTPLSALWRNRHTVTAFEGGRCTHCGTLQFPKSRICVNPNCNRLDTQEPHPFAEKIGTINSFTADRLTYCPDPPACYGMIQFDEGGRWMMDFTDVDADKLEVGQSMRMMFRIKDIDSQRGFRRYFWKAAPQFEAGGG